jgi:hypothetical protein
VLQIALRGRTQSRCPHAQKGLRDGGAYHRRLCRCPVNLTAYKNDHKSILPLRLVDGPPTYLVRKTEGSYGHALEQGDRVELILFSNGKEHRDRNSGRVG